MDIDRVYGILHLSRAQKAVIFAISLEGRARKGLNQRPVQPDSSRPRDVIKGLTGGEGGEVGRGTGSEVSKYWGSRGRCTYRERGGSGHRAL